MQNPKTEYSGSSFLRIPKVLFTDKRYSSLSSDCKMMYALVLDRASLSEKNNWVDSEGRVFIYFTFEEFCRILGWSREKVNKNLHQLTDCGLIDKKRQGLGKPSVIYVNESLFPNFINSENRTSESTEIVLQEVRKPNGNNTDINNTDYNKTDTTTSSVWDVVREQIDYDFLCSVHNKNDVDEIVNVICDTIVCKCLEVKLNGGKIPHSLVVARLRQLDSEHITYVLEFMSKNTEKIHNIRSYLLCLLYNAPSTMEAYYQMRVNTD